MIKARWRRVLKGTEGAASGPPVGIESKVVEEDAVSFEVSFAGDYWEKLETFLREKIGTLTQREKADAIALLLEYGAPEENTARELTTAERFAVGAKHSSLKFKMFECFQENKEIAVGLTVHLALNRSLKKQIAELRGAEAVPRDEWDSWNDAKVSELQNTYLFVK